jgi:hypothetical protein
LVLLFILIIAVVVFLYLSKPLQGQQGAKAEALTDKIQAAINQTAWELPFVSFSREITIISGTKRNLVQVEWDDKEE